MSSEIGMRRWFVVGRWKLQNGTVEKNSQISFKWFRSNEMESGKIFVWNVKLPSCFNTCSFHSIWCDRLAKKIDVFRWGHNMNYNHMTHCQTSSYFPISFFSFRFVCLFRGCWFVYDYIRSDIERKWEREREGELFFLYSNSESVSGKTTTTNRPKHTHRVWERES